MSDILKKGIISMAGREVPPTDTVAPKLELNPAQIQLGIQRLDERLKELDTFDVDKLGGF